MEHLPKANEEPSSGDKRSTLPLSTTQLVPSSELHFDDSSSAEEGDLLIPNARIAKSALTTSWQSLEESSDVETGGSESAYYQGSQADILQEMRSHPMPSHLETHKHGYQLSYELALDNMLTPFAPPAMNQSYGITYVCVCCHDRSICAHYHSKFALWFSLYSKYIIQTPSSICCGVLF